MVFGETVVFPSATAANIVIVEGFASANRTADDGVIFVEGCADGWKRSFSVFSAEGGVNAFLHRYALASVLARRLSDPDFGRSDSFFATLKALSFFCGFFVSFLPRRKDVCFGNDAEGVFVLVQNFGADTIVEGFRVQTSECRVQSDRDRKSVV